MRRENLKTRILTVAILALSTSWAVAAPPVDKPEKPAKPTKITILHCGCSDSGDALVMKEISVSSKSLGHQNHSTSSVESCDVIDEDGNVTATNNFSRVAPDCIVEPEGRLGFLSCDIVIPGAGEVCGLQE
ncbi:MAG: hypothetical protein OES20_14380 [Gammaproteobacteria bacterium]|nr:hypothetical protein [Gammaproteobacteria bacterium]MDH3857933.1 hypothetical protein [Gammaproteobacteria bacterium]